MAMAVRLVLAGMNYIVVVSRWAVADGAQVVIVGQNVARRASTMRAPPPLLAQRRKVVADGFPLCMSASRQRGSAVPTPAPVAM